MSFINITPIFWSVIRIIPRIPRNNLSKLLSIKKNFAVDDGIIFSSSHSGSFIIKENFITLIQFIYDTMNSSSIYDNYDNKIDIYNALNSLNDYYLINSYQNTDTSINDLDKLFSTISI